MRMGIWAGVLCLAVVVESAACQDVVPLPSAIVAEGIPVISQRVAEESARYTESRAAGFLGWHPQRRELLISTRFGNTAQVHEVRMPGGARRQLTFFPEPVASASWDPQQGRYLVFSRDTGGNEFSQLYRLDIDSGRTTLLTDGQRSQNGGVLWNRAKTQFVYTTTRRNGTDRDLWLMNPWHSEASRPLVQLEGSGWSALDWAPDDSAVYARQYFSVNRSVLWRIDAATGTRQALTPEDREIAWGDARCSADGRSLYVTSDLDSEFRRLGRMNLATREIEWLTTDMQADVESFDLSPDGSRLAYETNESGISRLWLYTDRSRPVAGLPAGVLGGMKWHANGVDLGFSLSSARSPSDVYSLNAETGELTRWTESELGGINPDQLSEPALIQWPSFDQRMISGFLYRPLQSFAGRRPVLISIHGGPESQSRPQFLGRSNYFLNELGVALIYPNVRGSSGFGKTFVALDNGLRREDSVKDIGALLDWIAQQPDLDSQRVMITGGSYGGYMTLACAVNYNDRIRCALDVVGISHFSTFLKNTESWRRDLRRAEYGDERDPEMAAFFEKIAPLNNADRIRRPLFVVQGKNDPRVPLSEAEQIVERVRGNGSPVWYLMARDEGHGFRRKDNSDFQFYATVRFMQEYLLGP
ncbi:MAG: peptidase prolyl oligopeptidase active site domain protein [Planctomycetota bacterium]